MTINRTSIGSQLKGNKMKKKPVKKASMGKFLETFSPAYSIMKGKGPISEGMSKLGGAGLGGIAGALASRHANDAHEGWRKIRPWRWLRC